MAPGTLLTYCQSILSDLGPIREVINLVADLCVPVGLIGFFIFLAWIAKKVLITVKILYSIYRKVELIKHHLIGIAADTTVIRRLK